MFITVMAEKKKKKKSAEDFVNSIVNDLTSTTDGDLFDAISNPTKVAGKVSDALLGSDDFSVEPTSTNIDNLERTTGLPEGLDSKTAVFGKTSESEPAFTSESTSKEATATAILPENQEPKYEPLSYNSDPSAPHLSSSLGSDSNIQSDSGFSSQEGSEKTVVVGPNRIHGHDPAATQEKVSYGVAKPSTRSLGSQNATVTDAQLMQAENLRIAQQRLNDLEKELEKLRAENEQMFATNEAAREKTVELARQVEKLEKEKSKQSSQFQSEFSILKDSFENKDNEIHKLRQKVEELEGRLRQDLRKIRVRERELENRLELMKMEKDALLRAKDETILELRRTVDQLNHELDGYRHRVSDLNDKIENNHEQLSRTVRALRLALTNLEVNEGGEGITLAPFKKAE